MQTYITYIVFILILLGSTPVLADTRIVESRITKDTVLTQVKSPYIIDHSITVASGVKITVEKDVHIVFDGGGFFFTQSSLVGNSFTVESKSGSRYEALISGDRAVVRISSVSVQGVAPRPVISVWNNSSVHIDSTNIEFTENATDVVGVQIFNTSTLEMINSNLSRFGKALDIFNSSSATVTDSVFSYNTKALYTFDSNIVLHHNDFIYNKIAVEFFTQNPVEHIVHAENNWWGSAERPLVVFESSSAQESDTNILLGDIIYAPWSLTANKKVQTGDVSNVLFLPGLMGSRLYQKSTFENQLWEPNRNKDVKKLFLDSQGKSIEKNIYTRDVMAKTNIVGGIDAIEKTPYKDFFTYMDGLVRSKVINSWKPAPYDWRYSPDTILEQGVSLGNSYGNIFTSSLVSEVILLAKSSKTKKVTLVTHSNGGLVGKQLMIELKNKNLEMLIDKIIFVAMPEYGTPQAITSLLYGHEQSIAGGLILNAGVAQKLGVNMPTAYTLLPSQKYFDTGKRVPFDAIHVENKSTLNIKLTEKHTINNNLLHKADQFHVVVDAWVSPPYIPVYQIVGTGLLTVSGYMEKSNKTPLPTYTTTGDGVVQDMYEKTANVFFRTGVTLAVDLHNTRFTHMDIMNHTGTMRYLDDLIRKKAVVSETYRTYPDNYTLIAITPTSATSSHVSDKRIKTSTSQTQDSLTYSDSAQFNNTLTKSSLARYDLFSNTLQYISQIPVEKLEVQEQKGNIFDLQIFNKNSSTMIEKTYQDIKLFPESGLSTSIGLGRLELMLPSINQKVEILPTKEITYDTSNTVISEKDFATSTEDFPGKIARIQNSINLSNMGAYVKSLYLSRLGAVLKTSDSKNLALLQQKAERAVKSIDAFSSSPILKSRYSKLRQDYIYLSYILK